MKATWDNAIDVLEAIAPICSMGTLTLYGPRGWMSATFVPLTGKVEWQRNRCRYKELEPTEVHLTIDQVRQQLIDWGER